MNKHCLIPPLQKEDRKKTAPAPPRRPPLIPTFDEWRSDRGTTGDNEKSAVSSSAESTPTKQVSSDKEKETPTQSTPVSEDGVSKSPKVSRADEANQADIKERARQVLMDARKKAGASGALPRERVAEIAKTAKGTTAGQTSGGSTTSGGVEEDKQKVKRWLSYCGKVNTFLVMTPSQFSLLHFIFFLRFYSRTLVPRLLTSVGLAQSVERLTAEREVAGSIPGTGPILKVLK